MLELLAFAGFPSKLCFQISEWSTKTNRHETYSTLHYRSKKITRYSRPCIFT